MNFEPGDIVKIVHHPISKVIGRSAEIQSVHPWGTVKKFPPLLAALAPNQTWYLLIDVCGDTRGCPHSWLRRDDPVTFPIAEMETEIS